MIVTKKQLKNYLLSFTLLGLVFIQSNSIISSAGIVKIDLGTYYSMALQYISIFIFARFAYIIGYKHIPTFLSFLYKTLIYWFVFQLIRGFIISDSYWEYKFLFESSITFTFISLTFFFGKDLNISRFIIRKYLFVVLPIALILLPFTYFFANQLFSRLAIPVTILILFIPYLKNKWKIKFLLILIIFVFSEPGFRTGIIKIIISVLLLASFYTRVLKFKIIKGILFIILLVMPPVLLISAITGGLNVFQELSSNDNIAYEVKESGTLTKQNTDTRTFLYVEVLNDLINTDNLILGKSPSQGYKSIYFADSSGAKDGYRFSSEVHVLNLLLHYGLVGFLLMLFLTVMVAYYGIYKSNNRLAITLGFLLLSRYLLFFIEEFTRFNFNFYFFWLIMGLVASKPFRDMDDRQIKLWIRDIIN